jgi:hypothetical protein
VRKLEETERAPGWLWANILLLQSRGLQRLAACSLPDWSTIAPSVLLLGACTLDSVAVLGIPPRMAAVKPTAAV